MQTRLTFSYLLFCILFVVDCIGHPHQPIALGEIFEELKYIDVSNIEPLTRKKFASFSFRNFKPVEGKVSESNFFEIGYNKKGEIREIVHYETKDSLTNYRMVVFDLPRYRLLTLGSVSDTKEYEYSSVVFVMDKNKGFNFMINTAPVLGSSMVMTSVGGVSYGGIESLSVIMILDCDFFPTVIYRTSEGRIVFHSEIKYKADREVDYEQARLFFSLKNSEDLKVIPSMCPFDLESRLTDKYEDMYFRLYPTIDHDVKFAPMWIFYGLPIYR